MNVSRLSTLIEEGDPALDARTFRRCLGQFATGVTIMTAKSGETLAGVTANSFSSLSMDPPLVLWSISRSSRSFTHFLTASHFAVNVLAATQIETSQRFASAESDKFAGVAWSPGKTGAPVLDGIVAVLECSREAVYEGGDHIIIVGRVERFARFGGQTLIFLQGRYGIADEHPDLKASRKPATIPADNPPGVSPLLLVTLIYQVYHLVSRRFDEHRKAEGITLSQGRILAGLYESPGLTLERLAPKMFLGSRDAEDAVAELLERSLVVSNLDGSLSLTKQGRERMEAISRRRAQFEAEQLAGIAEEDVACVRRVLSALANKQSPTTGTSGV